MRTATANRSAGNAGTLTANCVGGERAVGGGGGNFDQTTSVPVVSSVLRNSFPSDSAGLPVSGANPTSWSVNMTHGEAGNTSARAFVLCAAP